MPMADDLPDASPTPDGGRVDRRLACAGIVLPPAPKPAGNYRATRILDGWLYTSGQLSWRDGQIVHPGILGKDIAVAQAREAAAFATYNLLAQLRDGCGGDLDRIAGCARVTCFVACTHDFHAHPEVLDPVSDIICAAFGEEIGAHARLAYGAPALPFNSPIELEAVFRLRR
jgi:NAD(P)H dehydrogenase (quinone)